MFVDYSLIDSIMESSIAYTSDTGCDWLKQPKHFTVVLAETKQFVSVLFQSNFNCANSFNTVVGRFSVCMRYSVSRNLLKTSNIFAV